MRSWIKDPILLKNKEDLGIVSLFKTLVYDYKYADLDPIEKSCITYILVNWRNVVETASVAVTKDIEENLMQVMNDLVNAIVNAEMISERIQSMAEGF